MTADGEQRRDQICRLMASLGKNRPGCTEKTTVELAGRRWVLHFAPTPEYLAARQSFLPWAALGWAGVQEPAGAFLLTITGRAIIIEQLMIERTTQLKASKRLEATAKHRGHRGKPGRSRTSLLSQSLDSLEVGPQVVDHVQKLLQARVAVLYRLEPTSGTMVVLAAKDNFGTAATSWAQFLWDGGGGAGRPYPPARGHGRRPR